VKLDEIPSSMLAQAMEIYLQVAYPNGQVPPYVLELAQVDTAKLLRAAFERERVERRSLPGRPEEADKFRWRLGNEGYPHMKLGIERCSEADDFVFVVDTHDRDFPLGSAVLQTPEFGELLHRNSELKRAIEQRWQAAGIPTFSAHLTEYLRKHAANRPRPKTVLIVDDDEAVRELEQTLVEDAGYLVIAAASGADALAAVDHEDSIDLCLLDIMMPAMDGLEVARTMRSGPHPRIPIIYVTALPPDRTRDGLADDYIGKPFDPDHLLALIRRHIG